MTRAGFVLLVVIGVLCSTTAAEQCPENEVWTTCGSTCPPTCNSSRNHACTMQCMIGCQCKKGYIRPDSKGPCVKCEKLVN